MTEQLRTTSDDGTQGAQTEWWRDAVIYQIYPRSFADSNGDGIGDLPGITAHLSHLEGLGADAVWLSPFYVSPWVDGGYDVADYRDVDPQFGSLDDFDTFVTESHQRGMRVIVDLVPNHTSSEHPWFKAALQAQAGSPERERYIFRDGKGDAGELPPNNWITTRGVRAWTRTADGQWYLHLFDAEQPDLNWRNSEVTLEFQSILRFWLDRGVDGFRVDVASGLIKKEDLPDWEFDVKVFMEDTGSSPMWDQEEIHEIYRGWNSVLAEYDGDRMLVGEAWVAPIERLSRYVRADEMQQTFNFGFLMAGFDAEALRVSIDGSLAANAAVGATTTWVLQNHDVMRHTTRLGQADLSSRPRGIGPRDPQPDTTLGLRRARALSQLMLALPGSAYLYQGEELGLPDHTRIADEDRNDPAFFVSEGKMVGRDGCRAPLPWASDEPAFGFSPNGRTWLPQPEEFAELAADRQDGVTGSTLEFYRSALQLRRNHSLGDGQLSWTATPDQVLSFDNRDVRVIMNFSPSPFHLPEGATVLLASDEEAVVDGAVTQDHTVWLSLT